jgi:hypothetical protein
MIEASRFSLPNSMHKRMISQAGKDMDDKANEPDLEELFEANLKTIFKSFTLK